MLVLVAELCLTLCDSMDCSPPGSSVHGILQARILEWVAMPFSRGSPNQGTEPGSSALQVDSLLSEPPGSRRSLEKGIATHSSILAWRIPWTEEPGGATVHGVTKSWMWLRD